MTEYGITGLRDADGGLNAIEHTFQFNGEPVTIEFVPPTISESDSLEEMLEKEDLSPAEIQEPLNEYLVEPAIPDGDDWTLREFNCYIMGIYKWSMGQADGTVPAEISDELDEHGDEGN